MPIYWEQGRKRAIHVEVIPAELYKPLITDVMPFVIVKAVANEYDVGDAIYIIEKGGKRKSYWFIQIVIKQCEGLSDGYNLLGLTGPWGKRK